MKGRDDYSDVRQVPQTRLVFTSRGKREQILSKVVARIVIETEEWEEPPLAAQEYPLVQVQRIKVVHAKSLSSHELSLSPFFPDEHYPGSSS